MWLVESTVDSGDDAVLWIELWPQALRNEELAATREALDRRWRGAIAEIIHEGQQRGEFAGGDPDELARLTASLLDGLLIQVALEDSEVSSARAEELCLAVLERELGCAFTQPAGSLANLPSGGADLSGKRDTRGIVGLPGVAGRLRRRELLQAGAGAAVALGLSSCGIGRGLQGPTA